MEQLLNLFNQTELKEYSDVLRTLFFSKIIQAVDLKLGEDAGAFSSALRANDLQGALKIVQDHQISLHEVSEETVSTMAGKLGFDLMNQFK